MDWTVEFYRDFKGKEPAADFIDSLPMETQAKLLRTIDLLARYGVLLKEPYSRKIRGKIRELRVADRLGHIRVLKDVEAFNEERQITARTHLRKDEGS